MIISEMQMPLLYCIDYKASFSSIYNPQQEPPVHHPLFLGAVNMKDANIRSGIAFLRGNVQNVCVFFKCDV